MVGVVESRSELACVHGDGGGSGASEGGDDVDALPGAREKDRGHSQRAYRRRWALDFGHATPGRAAHLKDELMPKYAEAIYFGFWFAPEREMLQAAIDRSQEFVTGQVRLKLYKGNAGVVGRDSKYSLYDQDLVTFEDGKVAYDQRDAEGFIRLNALRLRTLGQRKRKLKLD